MMKLFSKPTWLVCVLFSFLMVASCSESNDDTPSTDDTTNEMPDEPDTPDTPDEPANPDEIIISLGASAADDAQTAFITVESGKTIIFEEGTYTFTNTLSMDNKSEIVIKGAGRDKTFLDFSGQTAGGEGVLVTNSTSIRFEDLTVLDSEGDALKARDCNKISFVNVGTVWSGDPSTDNGAYGLYPVLCNEVLIDGCYAFGASDAGIYVGQSNKVILKNCLAEGNVAGIEIENTTEADVYDNEATDNTGGILVFDLPGLTQSGSTVRVFDNNVHNNNRTNFAPEGAVVADVPAGTGCMILSTKNVEIFNNTFLNNNVASVLVASYLLVESNIEDPNYDPFPAGIFIHDNGYAEVTEDPNPVQPASIADLVLLTNILKPDIFIDGIMQSADAVCIQEAEGLSFVNLNALADGPLGSAASQDVSPQDCTKDPLPAIEFEAF